MPKWAKVFLRSIGILNTLAILLGFSFLVDSTFQVITGQVVKLSDEPYFGYAFAVMALIQLGFCAVLLVTAARFIRAQTSGATAYLLVVISEVAYFFLIGTIWRSGGKLASSVAAATGISDAMTPFEFIFIMPFLYPVMSAVFVQFLKRRYQSPASLVS